MDKNPDDILQNPIRGANMSEKKLTVNQDIYTNDELEKDNLKGGGTIYSSVNYEKTEYVRWLFASKEKFEGYWEGYDNVSKMRYSQVFKDYFHAQNNSHFINGSHGLQSSGAHRVEHGIAQGYAWAKLKWNIKTKKEIDELKDKNPGALSYSPQYKPVTIVGHSQGAAIAAGVALGIIYYAYEMGWEEIPINLLFLGTHQPQGLYGQSYKDFEDYYFEDFINEWVLEWVSDIFTKEKLHQNQGIYEIMNELLGDSSWNGLINRAVQFTFPNDRALFVTRMGDIPNVKNACNEKDNLKTSSWFYMSKEPDEGYFVEDEYYHFPKRLLDKAFNENGSINVNAPTFRQCVKDYWKAYHHYKNYRNKVKATPSLKYEQSEYKIPEIGNILPAWFQYVMKQAIAKTEGTKQKLYMQSELYRRKLNALLAFAKVHEMELQAHFAPVGLMFNKGVLSDWEDEYKDQTIWDRIQETGKDVFYKVHYSENANAEQKKQDEKTFVEGEGKQRMVKTHIANTPNIKKWIDRAKEELEIEDNWQNNLVKWWKGDLKYSGSGWGHGARREIAELIGIKDGDNINSLFEAGIHSMLQAGEVDISKSQRLIRKINNDPEFLNYEKELIKKIINNPDFKKYNFTSNDKGYIQLGGKRAEGEMLEQFKQFYLPKNFDTWKVAVNELTWLLRSITVISTAHVDKNGNVTISHQFEDVLDLRPSEDGSRSYAYDMVSIITGFLYHDAAGGNDLMKIKGKWTNSYSPKQLQDRLNEKSKGYLEDLKDNILHDARDIKNSVSETIDHAKTKIESSAGKIKDKVGDTTDKIKDKIGNVIKDITK